DYSRHATVSTHVKKKLILNVSSKSQQTRRTTRTHILWHCRHWCIVVELSTHLYSKSGLSELVLTLTLISTAGERFHFITVQGRHLFKKASFPVSTWPRVRIEPRANRRLVMKALRKDVGTLAFHPHVALRGLKAHAIPANVFGGSSNRNGFRWDEQCAVPDPGQGRLRQRYIARRKLTYIFEESPPSVPINGVMLRTTKDGVSYSSDYK